MGRNPGFAAITAWEKRPVLQKNKALQKCRENGQGLPVQAGEGSQAIRREVIA